MTGKKNGRKNGITEIMGKEKRGRKRVFGGVKKSEDINLNWEEQSTCSSMSFSACSSI